MTWRGAAWSLVALCGAGLGLACEPDALNQFEAPPRGFVLDAGQAPLPGPDAAPRDASVPPDPDPDAGSTSEDAGTTPTDAGEEDPTCACPVVPATCTPPAVGAPLFSADRAPMQEALIGLVSCAETSIRAALYEVQWSCLVDALFDRLARAPNLVIELVVDDDQCPRASDGRLACALKDLEAHPRVTVIDDARSAYMHHKFMIVDDARVWTGSANMTAGSFCTDHNDAMILDAISVVAAYRARFRTLFQERDFGPQPRVDPVRADPYTVHFSPQSPLSQAPSWHDALLRSIGGARTQISFAMFSFTRADIADALVAAKARGVLVRGVVSSRYGSTGATQSLLLAGIDVRKDVIHHKLMVVDTATVATGSANWSSNAWSNDEDALFIQDRAVAAEYERRIDAIFGQADPL